MITKKQDYTKRKIQTLIQEGICIRCWKQAAEEGMQICDVCREKRRAIRKNSPRKEDALLAQRVARRTNAKKWVDNGQCGRCGKMPFMSHLHGKRQPYQTFCEVCYLKRIAYKRCGSMKHWKILKKQWDKQNGCCTYTGEKLLLGINASLDHILPVCRFPEKRTNDDNFEWVTFEINDLKGARTKEEFLKSVKSVSSFLFDGSLIVKDKKPGNLL